MADAGICPRTGEYCEWRAAGETYSRVWSDTENEVQRLVDSRTNKILTFASRFLPGLIISPQMANEMLDDIHSRLNTVNNVLVLNCTSDEICIVHDALVAERIINPDSHHIDQLLDIEGLK